MISEKLISCTRRKLLNSENYFFGVVLCILSVIYTSAFVQELTESGIAFGLGIILLPTQLFLNDLIQILYLVIGASVLILTSVPRRRYDSLLPLAIATLGSFLPYVLVLTPPSGQLHVPIALPLSLILLGSFLSLISLFWLRHCFSVSPQVRDLVTSGPYAFIRHPMYTGGMVALAGFVLLKSNLLGVVFYVIWAVVQWWRAQLEERLLSTEYSEYSNYVDSTGAFFPNLRIRNVTFGAVALAAITLAFVCSQVELFSSAIPSAIAQTNEPKERQVDQAKSELSTEGGKSDTTEAPVTSGQEDKLSIIQSYQSCASADSTEIVLECTEKICKILEMKASTGNELIPDEMTVYTSCLEKSSRETLRIWAPI